MTNLLGKGIKLPLEILVEEFADITLKELDSVWKIHDRIKPNPKVGTVVIFGTASGIEENIDFEKLY